MTDEEEKEKREAEGNFRMLKLHTESVKRGESSIAESESIFQSMMAGKRIYDAFVQGEAISGLFNSLQDNMGSARYDYTSLKVHSHEVDDLLAQALAAEARGKEIAERVARTTPRPELTLVVHANDQRQVDAMAPIRWCLNQLAAEVINKRAKQFPTYWVMLSVVHETYGEIDRRVVPVEAMMEYLRFSRAGRHTIHAALLYTSYEGKFGAELRNQVLEQRTHNKYRFEVINREGKFEPQNRLDCQFNLGTLCTTSIDVVVPEQFFAKKPPEWLAKWTNYLFSWPAPDQCSFRRRLIFAFTLQPPMLFLWLVGKYVIAAPICVFAKFMWAMFATLIGVRPYNDGSCGVNWSKVATPFSGNFDDVWDGYCRVELRCRNHPACGERSHGGSFILYDASGMSRDNDFLLVFTPMVWFIGLCVGVAWGVTHHYAILKLICYAVALMLAVPVVVLIAGLVLAAVGSLLERSEENEEEKINAKREREKREAEERRSELSRGVGELLCQTIPLEVAVSALPKERQTIKLRYMALKAKVCRPFME